MNRVYAARALAASAFALAIVVALIGGFLVPDYSHLSDFISELGAVGTPWGGVFSWVGFFPIGLLVLAFLVVAAPLYRLEGVALVGYWLLSLVGFAYIGAALAPCDLGCPASGSTRQALHNLMGLLEYLGGGIGLLMLAGQFHLRRRIALSFAGLIAIAALFGMATPELGAWHGLIQRLAELALFGSLLMLCPNVAQTAD